MTFVMVRLHVRGGPAAPPLRKIDFVDPDFARRRQAGLDQKQSHAPRTTLWYARPSFPDRRLRLSVPPFGLLPGGMHDCHAPSAVTYSGRQRMNCDECGMFHLAFFLPPENGGVHSCPPVPLRNACNFEHVLVAAASRKSPAFPACRSCRRPLPLPSSVFSTTPSAKLGWGASRQI